MTKKYRIDQRGQNIGFWQAGRDCLRGTFSYGGYTTRKGYFFGGMVISLPGIILQVFSSVLMMSSMSNMLSSPEASSASFETVMTVSMLSMICYVLAAISGLPSAVRRLRDTGLTNLGIIIFLVSSLILSLLPIINIVVAIVDIYVFFQPSGRFLTDQKNHLLFLNRDEERQESSFYSLSGQGISSSSVHGQKDYVKYTVIGVIIISVLAIVGLSFLATNQSTTYQESAHLSIPQTIDLSRYDIVLYSDGQDGSGTAEVEITSIPYYEGYDEEVEQLLWNPTITLSKDSHLSNGDVVMVSIELDQDELDRLGIDATGIYEQYVTISTLDEPYVASSTTVSQEDWPLSKQNELAQYMIQFGNEMNQPNYQRISITKPVVWSGRELDENFKILDGYEYWYDNYSKVHRYIFVVNITGEPVVLYSKDTGDPEFYIVSLTQNEMLPIAFREIYY